MGGALKEKVREDSRIWALTAKALGKWLLVAAIAGLFCGLLGSAFHICVDLATRLRGREPRLLLALPLAGLLITGIYKLTRTEGLSTNSILEEVQSGRGLSLPLHGADPSLRRLRRAGGRGPPVRRHRGL